MVLLALAGTAPPAEAGVIEHRMGFCLAARLGPGAPWGGIAGEIWNRLTRFVAGNRSTIDPNGQPSPGEDTDNRSTIDPNGQPAAGASDDYGTTPPNG